MAKVITETFNKSADGWGLNGDPSSFGWQATGGDPKGYLAWVDGATGAISYYTAGPKFLGNKMAFYGGTLSYDILDTGNGLNAYDVQIIGDGKTLQYTSPNDSGFPTPNVWSAASLQLIAANFIDTATNAPPSVSEMKKVMKDITEIDIRAEYVNGNESGGLDNVVLARKGAIASATVPHQPHTETSGWLGHLG
jgi:alkaline phosphatase D